MAVTLIDKSPARGFEGKGVLRCTAGDYLCELLDIPYLTDVARVVSLLGFTPEGSYPIRAAALAARYVKLTEYNILLGREVGTAFGMRTTPYLEWVVLKEHAFAVLPHPSLSNPWWNDDENLELAVDFLHDALGEDILEKSRNNAT